MSQTLGRLKMFKLNCQHLVYLRHLSGINRGDLIKQSAGGPTNPDFLMQNLKNATTTYNILNLVSSHYKIMNSKHSLQALRALFTLQKCGNSELSTKRILTHPDFERICDRLRSQIGSIELNETIEALKVVSFVGVSSNSTIVQVLLQLLRHNINELSLPQIIFLDFLLKQFKGNPLIDALKIALPLVFEIQLPIKMDRDSLVHIAEYLHYASKRNVSTKCIESIIAAGLRCRGEMDTKTAISIIWSICDLEADQYFETLLTKALNVITMDVDNLTYNEMETTLFKLIYKYSTKTPFYYSDLYADVCANYVIDRSLGVEKALYILRKFAKISHVSNNLLDYVSNECYKNPDVILHGDPLYAYLAAMGMAATDHRPPHFEELKANLEQTEVFKDCTRKEVLWLKLAASLCILNVYKPEVLRRAFDDANIHMMIKKNYTSELESFVLVHAALSTFKPEFLNMMPSEKLLNTIQSRIKQTPDCSLEASLQKGLGGENYVKSDVRSELGFFIDHVVSLRPGGYPIPWDSTNSEILEKITSGENLMVLVLALRSVHYTLNCGKMKASTALMIKILETKGYLVVPVCLENWTALAEFERIPYLMQAIKTKTDECSNKATSTVF